MKKTTAAALLAALSLFLGGCSLFPSRMRTEELAVVQALGVDREDGLVRLSLVTAADSSRGEGPVRMSGVGATIPDAIEDISSRAAEEAVFCAHTGAVLLGEASAREDVEVVLRTICRSRELRMDVPLLIVRGESAEKALLGTGDSRVGAAELLRSLAASAEAQYGGELPSAARIAGALAEGKCGLAAAVECLPSSEQGEDDAPLTLAPAGLALIRDGKLAAFLEPEEAAAVDLLCGARGVHEFVVTDREGRRVTLRSAPGETELRLLRGADGAPEAIELTMRLTASVCAIEGESLRADGDHADELAAALERELLRRAGAVLRLQDKLGADFLSLRERAARACSLAERGRADLLDALPVRLSASVRVSHFGDLRGEG